MTQAIVFPGQGSQSVGMGKDLADAFTVAKEVFLEVDDALNQNLSKMMFEGSAEDLLLTENAQPALRFRWLKPLNTRRGIRWANIPRCAPRGLSISRRRRVCCVSAVARCSRRFPRARAAWRL